MRLLKAIAGSPCDSPARHDLAEISCHTTGCLRRFAGIGRSFQAPGDNLKRLPLDEKSASLADEIGLEAVRLCLIAFEYISEGQGRQQSRASAFQGSAPNAASRKRPVSATAPMLSRATKLGGREGWSCKPATSSGPVVADHCRARDFVCGGA